MSKDHEDIKDSEEHGKSAQSRHSRSLSKETGNLADNSEDDEILAKTLVHGQGADMEKFATRFYRFRQRRTEDAAQIQRRLAAAEERRHILIEEKQAQLRAVERQRLVKIQKTRSMRRVATEKFVKEALAPLKYMRNAGLIYATSEKGSLSPEEIEMILVNDPRSCLACANAPNGDISKNVCPITSRPHRRSLVTAAETFLKLVGGTCVNLIPNRIDTVGSSIPASSQSKAKRGISVNPQLFVLSYYNATLPIGDVDPLLKECSLSLIQITDELLQALERIAENTARSVTNDDNDSGVLFDEEAMKLLLVSFAKAWRQYAKLSDQNISVSERAHAQMELLSATAVTLKNTYKKIQSLKDHPEDSNITDSTGEEMQLIAMVAILRNRMQQIGGQDALAKFDEQQKLEENDNSLTTKQADVVTPKAQHVEDFSCDAPSEYDTKYSNFMGNVRAKQPKHPHNLLVVASPLIPSSKGFPSEPQSPVHPACPNNSTTHVELKGEGKDKAIPRTPYEFKVNKTPSFQEYIGTSGSDTDVDLGRRDRNPIPQTSNVVYGPALPPLWRIDPLTGKSEPPSQEIIQQEKFKQLEFRARKGYAAKMDIKDPLTQEETDAEMMKASLIKQHQDSFWEQFEEDLNCPIANGGPNLRFVPMLLNSVSESLIEALPKRLRQKIGQEIRDVLDWDLLRRGLQSTEGRMRNVLSLLTYVTNRVGQLGASVNEEKLHEDAQNLAKQLKVSVGAEPPSSTTPIISLGTVVASIFKFMFASIKKLQKDIADYSIAMLSKELAANATAYEQEFIQECIDRRKPSEWVSSVNFLKDGIIKSKTTEILAKSYAGGESSNSSESQMGTGNQLTLYAMLPPSVLFLQDSDRSLFAGMMQGVLDLLFSSGRDTETRWITYPKEILYFARPLIFEAANTVQLCTLRLLLTGTLTMILTPLQIDHPALQGFLAHLDSKVLKWLKGDKGIKSATPPSDTMDNTTAVDSGEEGDTVRTIEEIKDAIKDEIIVFLADNPKRRQPPNSSSAAPSVELTDKDFMVLRGVIDKMIDTTSPQYILFERRVMRAVTAGCLVRVGSAGSGLSQDGSAVAKASKSFDDAQHAAITNALHAAGKLVLPALNEVSAVISKVILQNWEVCRGYYREMYVNASEVENTPIQQ